VPTPDASISLRTLFLLFLRIGLSFGAGTVCLALALLLFTRLPTLVSLLLATGVGMVLVLISAGVG
jgi:hypothetical protein